MTIAPHRFTTEDRAEFDAWMQRIPSGGAEEAIFHALRLQVKHDVAGLHAAVYGYEHLLREADQVLNDLAALPGAISRLQAEVDKLASVPADVEALAAEVAKLSASEAQIIASQADAETQRARIWQAIGHLRMGGLMLAAVILGLIVALAAGWL